MLENDVDEKYYLSDTCLKGFLKHNENHDAKGTGFKWKPRNLDGVASCLRANGALAPTDNTVAEPKCEQVGNIVSTGNWDNPQVGRVYSSEGLSPTLNTMQGGNRQPKVIVENVNKLEPVNTMPDGTCRTLKHQYYKTSTANFLRNSTFGATGVVDGFRIRKLTPRECWRLMGFKDEYFDRVKGVSNTQLYKQAGNSIVVDVLKAILTELQNQYPEHFITRR